jgi:hypothetical protein
MNTAVVPLQPRRFSLGDAVILIAATAFTLALLRAEEWFVRFPTRVHFWSDAFSDLMGWPSWRFSALTRGQLVRFVVTQALDELIQSSSSVLVGLTLTQPMFRLRRPRPQWQDLIRQSGFAACLAVLVGTLLIVDLSRVARIEVPYAGILASTLLLIWPVLGLPPFRQEASWIDRLGRAAGWGWIVVVAIAAGFLYA